MFSNIIIMALQMCLALSVLIFIHELGHYLSAKFFGMKVEKFVIFFDIFEWYIFKYKYNDTEYKIGWLPIGGYVKISGMIDESLNLKITNNDSCYTSKPRWQRLIVILSGIIFNLIFGLLIFWGLTYYNGNQYIPSKSFMHNGIKALSLGKKIGFLDGDIINKVNNHYVNRYEDLLDASIFLNETNFTINRNNQEINIKTSNNIFKDILEEGVNNFIQPRFKFKIYNVIQNSPAFLSDIRPGDTIIALNNKKITFFDEFQDEILKVNSPNVNITVLRNENLILHKNMSLQDNNKIGILVKNMDMFYEYEYYSFLESLKISIYKLMNIINIQIKSLIKLILGELNFSKTLSGPIGIAQQFGGYFSMYKFLSLLGLLSIMLAIINILPIPALDGGHAFFLLIEMIMQRNINLSFIRNAQMIGMILLLVLTIFSFFNDMCKILFR
ncbi:MAG: RIP metalloprotease RseP [Bacteroides sp.]|nr:MAG: RIP metalloprotease RseP [Bacteroides sp.]